eukprot:5584653-Prymnesium_polylepis.2
MAASGRLAECALRAPVWLVVPSWSRRWGLRKTVGFAGPLSPAPPFEHASPPRGCEMLDFYNE